MYLIFGTLCNSGGGYVVELRGNVEKMTNKITELEQDGWIDRYTRAVFVEFTTYNAQVGLVLHEHVYDSLSFRRLSLMVLFFLLQVNLFGITTLAVEFMKSGGISVYTRVQPVNLLGFYSSAKLFQIACQIIYVSFILFFIIKEIRKFIKLGWKTYFKEPWNWVELWIIALSLAALVIFFYRLIQTKALTKKFAETNGNAYIRFQYVAYWNELLIYLVRNISMFILIKQNGVFPSK